MGNIDIKELLEKHGQGHIVKAYEALDAEGQQKLAAQVEKVDWKLLDMIQNKEEAQERGKLEPL